MINENKPLSMAESLEFVDKSSEISKFIKNFTKSNPKEAKEFREKLEGLELMKLNSAEIVKIIDLMPEDKEDLNKIFAGISLDENETTKILDIVKGFK